VGHFIDFFSVFFLGEGEVRSEEHWTQAPRSEERGARSFALTP
jgi:hypothetical protein